MTRDPGPIYGARAEDLLDIWLYVAARNSETVADRVYDGIEQTCELLSSTLPILRGVAERFGESLPECGRNFHAIRVEPGD